MILLAAAAAGIAMVRKKGEASLSTRRRFSQYTKGKYLQGSSVVIKRLAL